MTSTRRRVKQTKSLEERLTAFIQETRQEAEAVPPGAERNDILKRATKAEAAKEIDAWANSPGPRLRTARANRG